VAVSGRGERALSTIEMNISSFLKREFVKKVIEGLESLRGSGMAEAEELNKQLNQFR
jgi:hypothetical protein